ncbi:hypothetical protein ACKXGF_12290 [Alkalibacillus sp. S2W]|uniref:hypothetical protein n=1 Tax=Alkalibacillus sp. S2W TaxID=3386553 RepID=UPI00398CD38B
MFYDQYQLVVEPVYLELGSNVDNTTDGISLESDQQGLVDRLYEDDITQEVVDVTVE